jgi:hypothetical protein
MAALGRRVKTKYPGQYDDLTDEELGHKVKARYPDYDGGDFSAADLETDPLILHRRCVDSITHNVWMLAGIPLGLLLILKSGFWVTAGFSPRKESSAKD